MSLHDDCVSKQFVNDVVSIAILATCWHEVPMPPLEGEVPNEREAEGFVRKLSKKTPQSARSGCQLPFQGSQGGCAAAGGFEPPLRVRWKPGAGLTHL